tara:strand:+ start:1175 stop:1456 length:282 start_codon:yes stop_codon:yes gene_type:complete
LPPLPCSAFGVSNSRPIRKFGGSKNALPQNHRHKWLFDGFHLLAVLKPDLSGAAAFLVPVGIKVVKPNSFWQNEGANKTKASKTKAKKLHLQA